MQYFPQTILKSLTPTFDSNYANSAGVVYSLCVDIVNSNFTNHHVGFGNFTLDGKTFTQKWRCSFYGHECYVYGSNFINNSAFYGGAVDFTYVEVYNSTFKDNEAIYGGAIASAAECYIEYSNFASKQSLTRRDSLL